MRILSRSVSVFCLCILTGLLVVNFAFATRSIAKGEDEDLSSSPTEKIDINAAPLEDLVKLIHIGEVRALELISLRPFSSLDDLTRIKGIGKTRVEDIKKEGLAWIGTEEQIEVEKEIENNLDKEKPKLITRVPAKGEDERSSSTTYPAGIVINEILPSPEGPDAENEWIEIFNQNIFEVNLSGWQLKDVIGSTSTYTFPEGTVIGPEGFLALSRLETKITLNNDGDGLKLIRPDGEIIDSVSYEKAPRGQSYSLADSGWAWSITLTPGSTNIVPAPKPSEIVSPKVETPSDSEPKKELAAIGKQIPKSLSVLLTALTVAIFSGIIILILKTKSKKLYNRSI